MILLHDLRQDSRTLDFPVQDDFNETVENESVQNESAPGNQYKEFKTEVQ